MIGYVAGSDLNIKMRESLQLVMNETLVATISVHHPLLKQNNKLISIEELINVRVHLRKALYFRY